MKDLLAYVTELARDKGEDSPVVVDVATGDCYMLELYDTDEHRKFEN